MYCIHLARKTVLVWVSYLFLLYSLLTIGSGLYNFQGSGAGLWYVCLNTTLTVVQRFSSPQVARTEPLFSIINAEVVLYAVLYAPLLYYTFVVDSKYLRNSKAERRMLISREEYGDHIFRYFSHSLACSLTPSDYCSDIGLLDDR
jgi:hypothetical protein